MIQDPKTESLLLVGAAPFAIAAMPEDIFQLPTIAVDGGIDAVPGALLWVGDGDSGYVPQNTPAIFKTDQNKTDLAYTLDVIRSWAWRDLHLAGFWGGRFDHAMAVVGTLHAEMKQRPRVRRMTLYTPLGHVGAVLLPSGQHDLQIERAFSLLAIEDVRLTLTGACDYKADNLGLAPLSGQGVSNKGQGLVDISVDAPIVVIFPGSV